MMLNVSLPGSIPGTLVVERANEFENTFVPESRVGPYWGNEAYPPVQREIRTNGVQMHCSFTVLLRPKMVEPATVCSVENEDIYH